MALDALRSTAARDKRFARRLFAPLPDRYDRLAEWLSLGQNGRWRAEVAARIAEASPATVLDVASGTAGVALALNGRTGASVVGVDVSEDMVRVGCRRIATAGADRSVHLLLGRGEQLPFPDGAFEALAFSYLLRYVPDPAAALRELARVVRPGGVVASLEFLVPPILFWRFWWRGYTRLVLPLAGALTGGRPWFEVGRFLGPNISTHYRRFPVDWTVRAWRDAGIEDVGVRRMSLGGGLVMWGRRAGR